LKNLSTHFPIDTMLPLKVIEFDKNNKKIVLSALAALKEKSEEEIQEYLNVHKLDRVSVDNIKNAETGAIDSSEFPIFEVQDNKPEKTQES